MNRVVLERGDERRPRDDGLREAEDDPRLGDVSRPERRVEVGPRLDDGYRAESDAAGGSVPALPAAVGDPPAADGVPDVRPVAEPPEQRAEVGDLARPGELDRAAGGAVTAGGVGEDGVAGVGEAARDGRDRVLRAAETVQQEDAGPPRGR